MKYYLIVGEASGDLHASRLMQSLMQYDPEAEFRFFGGDLMAKVGGTRVKHYRELAYMGFVPVLLHLPTIFKNMKMCKEDIMRWKPEYCKVCKEEYQYSCLLLYLPKDMGMEGVAYQSYQA